MQESHGHLNKNGCFLSSQVREPHTDTLNDRPDLQLKLVQIFFRHGARTPIRITPGVEEATWDKETMFVEEDHLSCDYDVYSLDGKSGPHHSIIENSYQQAVCKGGAFRGQLTSLGMKQSNELGTYFKKHYMDKLNFLPADFNSDEIFLRSTNINRNLKSLSCLIAAMYGDNLREKQNGLPRIHVDHSSTEILYPNYTSSRPLIDLYFKTVKNTDVIPGIRHIRLQVQELLDHSKGDDFHLDLVSVRDGMSARQAHDFPISPILLPLAGVIEKAAVDIMKYCIGCDEATKDKLMYTVGPLLYMVLDNIQEVATGQSQRKLHLHACHDTTLMSILVALGAFDNTWPGLSSDYIIELYQDASGKSFVRNLYLGKELKLGPDNLSVIPLDQFRELLAPLLISPEDFKESLVNIETF